MDSIYSDSRPMYVQSPYGGWNQTQMIDSMANPMNNEQGDLHSQSESQSQPPPPPQQLQPSLKRARLVDDNNQASSFPPPTSNNNNNAWIVPSLNPPPPVNKGTANIFYKTRMCAKFRAGTCRNGELCNFAHGIEDLRQPPSNWQEIVGPPVEDRERERERENPDSFWVEFKIIWVVL